tara:strand:+ start:2790 stop:3272 length:483 start_codon:yes stop_codon:yes gene_type:complete
MSQKNKFFLIGILVFSLITLLIAFSIQYILAHKPCNLCIIERYPYYGAVILIGFLLVVRRFYSTIFYLLLILFVFGSIVSFYHVGIEQGFFKESFVCDLNNTDKNMSKDDILKQLQNSTPISCKDVTFRFLGLSLATINTIISIFLSGIMIRLIKNNEQN